MPKVRAGAALHHDAAGLAREPEPLEPLPGHAAALVDRPAARKAAISKTVLARSTAMVTMDMGWAPVVHGSWLASRTRGSLLPRAGGVHPQHCMGYGALHAFRWVIVLRAGPAPLTLVSLGGYLA